MNTTTEIRLTRGARQYAIRRLPEIANDRFVGFLDGDAVVEGDSPEAVLVSLIRLDRRDRGGHVLSLSVEGGAASAAAK